MGVPDEVVRENVARDLHADAVHEKGSSPRHWLVTPMKSMVTSSTISGWCSLHYGWSSHTGCGLAWMAAGHTDDVEPHGARAVA